VVTLELSFVNKVVPAPQSGSLSFGGFVTWSGGASPFHMPWTTVKAGFLTIDVKNNRMAVYAEIMGDRKKLVTADFGQRMRTLWRLEPVDIALFEDRRLAGDYPVHISFAESVEVKAGGAHVTIDMDDAKYTFDTANALGPDGKPLLGNGRWCIDEAIMAFPGGKKFGFGQASIVNEVAPDAHNFHVLWSRLSPRVKIYVSTLCSDVGAKAIYAAAHDRVDGLESDFKTTMSQAWVTPQPMRFVSDFGDEPGLTVAYARQFFPAGGDKEAFYAGSTDGHFLRPIASDLTMHYTKRAEPGIGLLTNVERYGPCPSGPDCTLIDNVWIYPDETGSTVDSDLYLEISPMAYRTRPDRSLVLGDTPVFPFAGFGGGDGLWVAGAGWRGAFGERRTMDGIRSHVTAYDASGKLIGEGTGSIVKEETLPPGRYRMEATSPELMLGGHKARGVVEVTVDTSRPDWIAPKFTGIRVEDEDRHQTSTVKRQSRATLLFSAVDEHFAPYAVRRTPREEATRVEYRLHGTSDWHPLPALAVARHIHSGSFLFAGVGTMFRVDLSAVTGSSTGPIDLRFHIEDEPGNTATYTLAPAFIIDGDAPPSEAPRRRSVRH
jgi:hypothetical protein